MAFGDNKIMMMNDNKHEKSVPSLNVFFYMIT